MVAKQSSVCSRFSPADTFCDSQRRRALGGGYSGRPAHNTTPTVSLIEQLQCALGEATRRHRSRECLAPQMHRKGIA